ncbi:hypothetical protein JTB14_021375 [Gonioctena quinquepunctata]|nr:hypothetical protein JTB14_021375 [Gonioctena quinquepunctata]
MESGSTSLFADDTEEFLFLQVKKVKSHYQKGRLSSWMEHIKAAVSILPYYTIHGTLGVLHTVAHALHMDDYWLKSNNIMREMWNCHGHGPRTSNALEEWNNRLDQLLKPYPNIFELVKILKKEAEYMDYVHDTQYLNLEGKRRKKKY